MTAYGPLFPNDDELRAVVNSIYGPGALGGWLILSCVSLLISLASPDDRDAINKDWLGLRLSNQNLQQGSLSVWQE